MNKPQRKEIKKLIKNIKRSCYAGIILKEPEFSIVRYDDGPMCRYYKNRNHQLAIVFRWFRRYKKEYKASITCGRLDKIIFKCDLT